MRVFSLRTVTVKLLIYSITKFIPLQKNRLKKIVQKISILHLLQKQKSFTIGFKKFQWNSNFLNFWKFRSSLPKTQSNWTKQDLLHVEIKFILTLRQKSKKLLTLVPCDSLCHISNIDNVTLKCFEYKRLFKLTVKMSPTLLIH